MDITGLNESFIFIKQEVVEEESFSSDDVAEDMWFDEERQYINDEETFIKEEEEEIISDNGERPKIKASLLDDPPKKSTIQNKIKLLDYSYNQSNEEYGVTSLSNVVGMDTGFNEETVTPQYKIWTSKNKKENRNHGIAYTTKNHKVIPPRKMKDPCGNKCRLKCREKINESERIKIFKQFWALGDINKQRQFLAGCTFPIKSAYPKMGSTRASYHAFFLTSQEVKIKVCKTFLSATLGISPKVISTTITKTDIDGTVEPDLRGKRKNKNQQNQIENKIHQSPPRNHPFSMKFTKNLAGSHRAKNIICLNLSGKT